MSPSPFLATGSPSQCSMAFSTSSFPTQHGEGPWAALEGSRKLSWTSELWGCPSAKDRGCPPCQSALCNKSNQSGNLGEIPWINSPRLHRLSQLRWKWLHAEDHPEMFLRNILGVSRDQERVRSIWRKAAGDTHERDPSSQWENLWVSSSFGWVLAAWKGAGVGLEPPSSLWDCASESASPEVITSLLSLFKDNFKCMTGSSRENRRTVGIAEDLSPARGDVFLLWNQTSVREQSCRFISLFFSFTCSIDPEPVAVGSWRGRFVNSGALQSLSR